MIPYFTTPKPKNNPDEILIRVKTKTAIFVYHTRKKPESYPQESLSHTFYNEYMTLTPKQKQIYDFIKTYSDKKGFSPIHEEIAKKFKLAVSTIHEHLSALERKGYIKKDPGHARTIEAISPNKNSGLVKIPLLGTIAAGQPIEAVEVPEEIEIPKSDLPKQGNFFALKVAGDSMIDEGIFDGNTVIVREQSTAENGDTVVALLPDNKVTLKKFYKEKDKFRLQPANPKLKPLYVSDLTIQGKVEKIIRDFAKPEERIGKEEFHPSTTEYIEKADLDYRKSLGQYFTPKTIREALLSHIPNIKKNPRVLDPACGTGEFLISANSYFDSPKLYGWDIDQKMIEISKKTVPASELITQDGLLNTDYGKFDVVIGNPPYFEFKPSALIRDKFKHLLSGRVNIFGLFIAQAIRWLKDDGYLAFVVPPSMNNGAYFAKLREYIIANTNIEYLKVLRDPKIFQGALQSTMVIVLKKGKNKGDYVFSKNGITIFSENPSHLKKVFNKKVTLQDLNHEVKTGRVVWNQNKHLLTNKSSEGVPLIWAHNIKINKLDFPIVNDKKPQYIKKSGYEVGPAIVVNRISGSITSSRLRAAIIPTGMKFFAENHVNVIYPPNNREQTNLGLDKRTKPKLTLEKIASQISSEEKISALQNITGNTQISRTELKKLLPLSL